MRRKFLVGFLGIAGLCAGSIAAIYAFTRGASGDVSPPAAAEIAVEPVAAPAAAVARAAPPRPEQVASQSAAAAPESAPVRRAKLARPPIPKPRPAAATPISVSFKMDPRLTSGVHIGTRWVSTPTYVGVQAGNLFRVPARAGSGSRASGGEPTWLPARPDMVTVTPERGSEVEISVLREGRSTIMVASADASATLTVNAVREAGLWRVDISQ